MNIALIDVEAWTVVDGAGGIPNNGTVDFTLPVRHRWPGKSSRTYQFYIQYVEDGKPITWTYGPHFTVVSEVSVSLDIKPDDAPNSINLKSQGVLPVAILSTEDYNALEVDESTVYLVDSMILEIASALGEDPPMVFPVKFVTEEDVNGDGLDDLLLFFSVSDLVESGALDEGTEEVTLIGEMFDGIPIKGFDSVRIVPGSTKGKGKK